jgi:AraC-like DNA-binding protein
MSSSIALVRASALLPTEHGLRCAGLHDPALFLSCGLPANPAGDPFRLVSLHSFLDLLALVNRREGPDFVCNASTPDTLMMLDVPASAVRAARTVREALISISQTFHLHSSNVFFVPRSVPGGMEINEAAPIGSSPEAFHAGHQSVAGMVSALGRIIDGEPLPARIRLCAHPEYGVEHLKPHLGPDVEACQQQKLMMFIPDAVLDQHFAWEPLPFGTNLPELSTAGCDNLLASARLLIEGMLHDGICSLDQLARAAGRSRRTMQRLLAAEGTNFAELADSVRRDVVLSGLSRSDGSVAAIAGGIGYRNSSSLTRAVRRWTDESPRAFRSHAAAKA